MSWFARCTECRACFGFFVFSQTVRANGLFRGKNAVWVNRRPKLFAPVGLTLKSNVLALKSCCLVCSASDPFSLFAPQTILPPPPAPKVLVKHYADPQVRNMRGQTPLDVALASWIGKFCKEKIARLLSTGHT